MGIWTLDDHLFVEDILEFDFVQPVKVTFKGCIDILIHRKEERSPGILYGWARICLSCLIIIPMALP